MRPLFACRETGEKSSGIAHLKAGFTLVELLVSMTVLTVLLLLVTSVVGSVQSAWKQSHSKVSEFREARKAFDRMVNAISQASLNNYLVYRFPNSADPLTPPSKTQTAQPSGYARFSELQFICGRSSSPEMTRLSADISPGHAIFFQAPMGTTNEYRLPTALNGCGFFVQFGSDATYRPDFLSSTGAAEVHRYRLYEYRSPTERNRAYDASSTTGSNRWYEDFADWSRPIANNVILLVLSPRRAEADDNGSGTPTDIAPLYSYNTKPASGLTNGEQAPSDYQLPPMMGVTFVVIDEASAANLSIDHRATPPLSDVVGNSSLFVDANRYNEDLDSVVQGLVQRKLNFRVFTATIPIRASKWGQGT